MFKYGDSTGETRGWLENGMIQPEVPGLNVLDLAVYTPGRNQCKDQGQGSEESECWDDTMEERGKCRFNLRHGSF